MNHSPSPRFHNSNWALNYQSQYSKCQENQPTSILLGDSMIAGLTRYQNIWDSNFSKINTVNCGIGGDRIQNVHWRAEKLPLSPSLTLFYPEYLGSIYYPGGGNVAHPM